MGALTWVFGIIGGLCAIMGIITAAGVVASIGAAFTPMFWLALAGVLLLICIATALSRGQYE